MWICHKIKCEKKAKDKIINELKQQVIAIQKQTNGENVIKLNSMILGIKQYYKCATMASKDFRNIAFVVNRSMFARFNRIAQYGIPKKPPPLFDKLHKGRNFKTWKIHGVYIYPIFGVKHQPPMSFSQEICDYTPEGREKSNKSLRSATLMEVIKYAKNYNPNESV